AVSWNIIRLQLYTANRSFDALGRHALQPGMTLDDDTATADKHHAPVRRRERQLATLDGIVLGLVAHGRVGHAEFVEKLDPWVEGHRQPRQRSYVLEVLDDGLRQ